MKIWKTINLTIYNDFFFFFPFFSFLLLCVWQKKSNPSNPSNAGMTTPKNDPKGKDADFSASKFFVAAIPDFDRRFSPKRGNESKQQSGQSSGGNLDSLRFNSCNIFRSK